MKYAFHPAAEAVHLSEVAFYESRRKGLGARYLASFNAARDRVCKDPAHFRIECEPNLRRAMLQGFPFAMIYREVSGQVQVLAVAHHKRRPGDWADRI